MIRPAPTRLQGEPTDLGAADLEQVQGAVIEAAGLVGRGEALLFCFPAHRDLPSSAERSGDQRGRRRLQSACTGLAGSRPPGFNTGMKSLAVRVLSDFGVDGIEPQALGSREARLGPQPVAPGCG